jgi:hypothetical protein
LPNTARLGTNPRQADRQVCYQAVEPEKSNAGRAEQNCKYFNPYD